MVLVGPGHNGGDGLVIARELQLAGIATRLWSPFEQHKPLTESHLNHCLWLGLPRLEQAPDPAGPQLWIDALWGIGQRRPLPESIAALLAKRQQLQPGGLVAVDVPSGLCADSGELLGQQAAAASHTYCIGLVKQGLVQDAALPWVGRLERVDLGLPATLLETLPAHQPLALWGSDGASAPWPQLPANASKYARGRLLVVAGSDAYRGAARLCLAGARASGAGSLRAALPKPVAEHLWTLQPEVVLSAALPCHPSGGLDLSALPATAWDRLDAVVLGPGIGPGPSSWQGLQQLSGLLVLDADGLNRLAQSGSAAAWLQRRSGPTWITPHRGEFDRLFPELAARPPLEAAGEAARLTGCSVLLKGAHTLVAAADGRLWQIVQSCPAAARAGLGDVLAGLAGGLGAKDLAAGGAADASLLALAALAHAEAGSSDSSGGPMAVAEALGPMIRIEMADLNR